MLRRGHLSWLVTTTSDCGAWKTDLSLFRQIPNIQLDLIGGEAGVSGRGPSLGVAEFGGADQALERRRRAGAHPVAARAQVHCEGRASAILEEIVFDFRVLMVAGAGFEPATFRLGSRLHLK